MAKNAEGVSQEVINEISKFHGKIVKSDLKRLVDDKDRKIPLSERKMIIDAAQSFLKQNKPVKFFNASADQKDDVDEMNPYLTEYHETQAQLKAVNSR